MCSLCAALGGSRAWTDAAGKAAFATAGRTVTIGAERRRRVSLLNEILAHYGLSIADWGGNSYVLSDAAGRTANMYTLGGIWAEVDRLAASACDPLDPDLVARLAAVPGSGSAA